MNVNLVNNSVQDNTNIKLNTDLFSREPEVKAESVMPFDLAGTETKAFSQTIVNGSKAIVENTTQNFEKALKEKALVAKENLTNLFNKLTTMDLSQLEENGMQSINDTEIDEAVNVIEEIKIMLATYCEDYIPVGDIDMEAVREITGSEGMAAKVMKKLSSSNMPITKDNVFDVTNTVEEYKSLGNIDENVKRYLLKNNLEPTIDNIYKAKYSKTMADKGQSAITNEQFEAVKAQAGAIIEQAGFEVNEETLSNAKIILSEGAPLTEETLQLAMDIDSVSTMDEDTLITRVVENLLVGGKGKDTLVINKPSLKDKAIDTFNALRNVTIEDVLRVINGNVTLNVENLSAGSVGESIYIEENATKYKEAVIALNKAQLSLSAGTLFTMEKLGIDTSKMPLNELVTAYEKVSETNEVMLAVKELENAPVNVLGEFVKQASYSISEVVATSYDVKWRYNMANEAYETFGTAIRSDLGDNLNKAVDKSAGALLMDMNLSGSDEQIIAVKILSYSNIEMTEDNVIKVAGEYKAVTNIISNISPKMVLEMIRKGENPLTADINALSDYVDEYNANNENSEDFARFLYKLEKNNEITLQERQDYIGLYKVLTSIKKDDAKSLGAIMSGNMELTLNNMIMSYVSRKHSGQDKSIGENTQFVVGDGELSYYKKIFTNAIRFDSERMSQEYYQENLDVAKEAAMAEESVIRLLTDNDQPVTINNVLAAMDYKSDKVYRKLLGLEDKKITERLKNIFDEADTEELLGEELDKLRDDTISYKEELAEKEDLTYEKYVMANELVKNVSLMAELSKRHEYKVPVVAGESVVSVSLKIVKSGEESGKVSVSFYEETRGNVNIVCRANEDKLDVLVLSDREETLEFVQGKEEELKAEFAVYGFKKTTFSVGKITESISLQGSFSGEGNVATTLLYKVARTFISQIVPN